MIIEALVRIELKSDGTWQIVGLKALTETLPPVRGRGKNPASRTTVLNVEKLTEIN